MKVAVCIPTWNRSTTLIFAIDSLLHQKQSEFDIYIFDDASPDNTQEVIKTKYADKVNYFRSSENIGYVNNINRCLALAEMYDWIGILHDDDCHVGESVATTLKYARKYPNSGIIFSQYHDMNAEGEITLLRESEERIWMAGKDAIQKCQSQIPCSTTFYSSRAILDSGFYSLDFLYSADEEYATRIASRYDVTQTKEVLACYRRHRGHQMIKTWCKPDFIQSFEKMRLTMAQYLGTERKDTLYVVRQNIAEIFQASAGWLAAEGHWYPALRFHIYAVRYRPKLYFGWKPIVHAILQSTPLVCQMYNSRRLGRIKE